MGVAFACIVLLEFARLLQILPHTIKNYIDNYLSHYVYENEQSGLILSHFYLLIGCALPVWLSYG